MKGTLFGRIFGTLLEKYKTMRTETDEVVEITLDYSSVASIASFALTESAVGGVFDTPSETV